MQWSICSITLSCPFIIHTCCQEPRAANVGLKPLPQPAEQQPLELPLYTQGCLDCTLWWKVHLLLSHWWPWRQGMFVRIKAVEIQLNRTWWSPWERPRWPVPLSYGVALGQYCAISVPQSLHSQKTQHRRLSHFLLDLLSISNTSGHPFLSMMGLALWFVCSSIHQGKYQHLLTKIVW